MYKKSFLLLFTNIYYYYHGIPCTSILYFIYPALDVRWPGCAMDTTWKLSKMCGRHWFWWLLLWTSAVYHHRCITKNFRLQQVSVISRSLGLWYPIVKTQKHTASKRCFFPPISLYETSIRGYEFHKWITAVARDSNIKARKYQKTCLQTAHVLSFGCSVDPTHGLSEIFDIYSKISQPQSRLHQCSKK